MDATVELLAHRWMGGGFDAVEVDDGGRALDVLRIGWH